MKKIKIPPELQNINDTLFAYVTDTTKWFYWYHSPQRLEALYKMDHYDEYKKKQPDYKNDNWNFTKRVWRFESETIGIVDTFKPPPYEEVVIEKNLAGFFDAVLDEIRLKKANAFAEYALYISDNEDLAYFRDTVAKREVSADIDYDRQRDHAVHTLYNYLLGWYIFEHSIKLQKAFENHFKNNLSIDLNTQKTNLTNFYDNNPCGVTRPTSTISISEIHEFADVWFIASLLHDIGYILEGQLSSASAEVENLRVANGSRIIHDYFNHYFWKSFGVDFRAAKNIAKILGVVIPDFSSSRSLASLGDHLCDIGSCENIRIKLKKPEYKEYQGLPYKPVEETYGLNREAFSIWKEHYKCHGNKKMEDILYVVERVYKNMVWVGDDHGNRTLDHGVCSGLITLQALTFFRELFGGFCQINWLPEPRADRKLSFSKKQKKQLNNTRDRVSQERFNNIKDEITHVPRRITVRGEFDSNDYTDDDNHCQLRSDFWFKKILWATAASAIHAIIQKDEYRKQCRKHINSGKEEKDHLRIGLDDDPLAFLGVLVDTLQEWDRYKIAGRGESAFSGDEPLQSTEVNLYPNKNDFLKATLAAKTDPVYLTYPAGGNEKKKWVEDLKKTMDSCLETNCFDNNQKDEINNCSGNTVNELKKTLILNKKLQEDKKLVNIIENYSGNDIKDLKKNIANYLENDWKEIITISPSSN